MQNEFEFEKDYDDFGKLIHDMELLAGMTLGEKIDMGLDGTQEITWKVCVGCRDKSEMAGKIQNVIEQLNNHATYFDFHDSEDTFPFTHLIVRGHFGQKKVEKIAEVLKCIDKFWALDNGGFTNSYRYNRYN